MLFLLAALALCFGVLVFAAFSHVPLIQEGSAFYFEILSNHRWFYDKGYLRLFDTLLQLPAVVYLRLARPDDLTVPTLLLDLPYMLHPIAGVLATYALLKKYGRTDLFFLPVLALATSAMPVLGFAVSTIGPALSLFWPLFVIASFERAYRPAIVAAGTALAVCLAFTHESSVFLFAAVGFAAWRARAKFLLALSGAAVVFMLYRVTVPAPYAGHFLSDLKRLPDAFRLFTAMSLAGILAALAALVLDKKRNSLWIKAMLASVGLSVAVYLVKTEFFREINGGAARFARTTAALACAATGLWIALLEQKLKTIANSGAHVLAQLCVSLVLVVASIHLLTLTFEWRRVYNFASIYASEMKGCYFISKTPHPKLNYYSGPGGITGLTILAQQTRYPRSIFFQLNPDCPQEPAFDPCRNYRDGAFQRACGSPFQIEGSHFDFSYITVRSGQ